MNKTTGILILIALMLAVFHKVFYVDFAYSDSYDFLLNAEHQYFFDRWVQSGRVLFGFASSWVFTQLDLTDLKWVRLFALLGSVLFLLVLFDCLSRYYKNYLALVIVLLVAFSPSITVISLWTSTFQVSWSLFLSIWAGRLAVDWFNSKSVLKAFMVLIFSLIALNLYQPGYTAFIIPAFLVFLNDQKSWRVISRQLVIHLGVYAFYFIVFKLTLFFLEIEGEPRSGVDLNIIHAVKWLFKHAFAQGAALNFIFAPRWMLTLLYFGLLALFLFFFIKVNYKEWGTICVRLITLVIFYALSVFPNFLAVDDFISYRMLTVLLVVNCILIVHIISSIGNLRVQYALLSIFTIASVSAGYYNTNYVFIGIQAKEYHLAEDFVSNIPEEASVLLVVPPDPQFLIQTNQIRRTVTDEYGKLSNAIPWVPKPFFTRLLKRHQKKVQLRIANEQEDYVPNEGEEIIVFDFGKEWVKKQ